jgi:GNAT superfamily N-acetyltransferase
VEIRDATAEDLPALARLGAKLAREHHAMDPARFFAPEEPVEEGYAWWLGKERKSRQAVVLAAVARGRVVGYAYGRIEARDWNSLRDRCGVGVDLWVEPRARRSGIGTALVETASSWASRPRTRAPPACSRP